MAAQNEWRNGGIINPFFNGLTYNTSEHFAHCSYFSSPLKGLGKILRNSENIRAYYMLNHRIRCIYSIRLRRISFKYDVILDQSYQSASISIITWGIILKCCNSWPIKHLQSSMREFSGHLFMAVYYNSAPPLNKTPASSPRFLSGEGADIHRLIYAKTFTNHAFFTISFLVIPLPLAMLILTIVNTLRLLQTFVGLLLPKLLFFDHIKANYLNLHFPKKLT